MNKQDFLDIKKQIESQGFKPTTIWMHPTTWKDIVPAHPMIYLYDFILNEGYSVIKQTESESGFVFKLEKPGKTPINITLKYCK